MGPEEHARRLKHALAGLRTSDPVAIADALTSLKELEGRAAAEAIAARVKEGLPPQLTERALEVLAGSQQPVAAPALSELTLHRRWQIRAQAVAALGALRVRSTVSVLLYALDDPSPEVRSAAARALGMAGDPRAIRALEAALARGVDGALEGLAQLVPSKQIDAILARAKVDLVGCEPALWQLLTRTNLPVVTKLKVLSFVQAHDSEQEAAQVLAGWQSKLKERGDARLLAAAAKPTPATKAVAAVSMAPATAAAAQGGK
jgi:HEAT repeat protein